MKYVIKNQRPTEETPVWLEQVEDTIVLVVNDWNVFELRTNGKGYLNQCIPNENGANLKVDEKGRLILEK